MITNKILGSITVDVTYPNGETIPIDFNVASKVCLGGMPGQWYPGVVSLDTTDRDTELTIAYAINEGRVVADEIEADPDTDETQPIKWRVQDKGAAYLRELGVVE